MIGNGISRPVQSIVPGSTVTTDRMVELVKTGKMFTIQTVIESIAINSTVDILFNLSGVSKDYLVLYELLMGITDGSAVAHFYLPGDYTGGNVIQSTNRNENSSNVAESILTHTPTGTAPGTKLPTIYQIGTESTHFIGGAGSKNDVMPQEINQDVSRLLRIIHSGGTDTFNLELRIMFAEI